MAPPEGLNLIRGGPIPMNVPTIVMSRYEARDKLRAYRSSIHTKADAEYQAAEKAYAALARGTPILTVAGALAVVPRDAKGRPCIAIARCDVRQAGYHVEHNREVFWPCGFGWTWSRSARARSVSVPRTSAVSAQTPTGYSIVPMIPPDVKPRLFDPKTHWVLWEVAEWADQPIRATPDRDPMLLRRLAPDLWAVIATWDLSAVEMMVMAGRAHA